MNWYIAVLKKYVVFDGRASRSEYWFFTLFNSIVMAVLYGIAMAIFFPSIDPNTPPTPEQMEAMTGSIVMMVMPMSIYSLAVFLPTLGVTIRRLHDTDHSGWWIFINLVPFIGGIIFLIFLVKDSDAGSNRFGSNPKGIPPV